MKSKNSKGVTLIALVVTIIILLILVGVVLSLTIGKSGIINNAEIAGEETNRQTATEKMNLKITNSQMNSYALEQRMPTLQELADDFCEDNEIEYVTLTSKKLANLDKIEVGENSSIFTKLKEYPYEFEINSSLQLASVDGIKTATNTKESTQPTGIKTDIYIYNTRNVNSIYSIVTSMTGFTRTTDPNNNIAEYLSYSDQDGYTVLRSGWYYVNMSAEIQSSSSADLVMNFLINNSSVSRVVAWSNNGSNYGSNSFSIYLSKDDKIYFNATASGGVSNARSAYAYVYPMF